ncbi:PE-PPE domain-containing protein [Mycolicibacterium gilvum]|uniref:PE-PPE domain-containing protein n=1 Tax=Mycolicibacterium gilvum TaxID=1804 RepID=UPI004045A33A
MAKGHNAGKRTRRRRATGIAAAVAIPLLALPVGGASASAATTYEYFPTEPTRVLTLSLLPGGNNDDLNGVMCESPRTCRNVVYSRASTPEAVGTLDAVLRDGTGGKQIVFAYSQGARVTAAWMREHGGTEGVPTAENLTFVLMGNPARKYSGSDKLRGPDVFPDLGYKIIDVSQEYDMASDFPDDTSNLLAMLNSTAGFFFTHQDYEPVDIYDEANYVWIEGDITYVFVPTEKLPLLKPLRWFGLGFIADALNGPLKAVVDRAYDRSYLPAQPGFPPIEDPEIEEPQEGSAISAATVRSVSARSAAPRPIEQAPIDVDIEVAEDTADEVIDEGIDDQVADEDLVSEVSDDDAVDDDAAVVEDDPAAPESDGDTEAGASGSGGTSSPNTGGGSASRDTDSDSGQSRQSAKPSSSGSDD